MHATGSHCGNAAAYINQSLTITALRLHCKELQLSLVASRDLARQLDALHVLLPPLLLLLLLELLQFLLPRCRCLLLLLLLAVDLLLHLHSPSSATTSRRQCSTLCDDKQCAPLQRQSAIYCLANAASAPLQFLGSSPSLRKLTPSPHKMRPTHYCCCCSATVLLC